MSNVLERVASSGYLFLRIFACTVLRIVFFLCKVHLFEYICKFRG